MNGTPSALIAYGKADAQALAGCGIAGAYVPMGAAYGGG